MVREQCISQDWSGASLFRSLKGQITRIYVNLMGANEIFKSHFLPTVVVIFINEATRRCHEPTCLCLEPLFDLDPHDL